MKKGFHLITAGALFAALSFSSAVSAGNAAGDATFTLGSGYERFSLKRRIDNTSVPFVALGFNFTDQLALEALLGGFTTTSNRPEDNGSQVRGTLFALDGMYRFAAMHDFQPYVMAGPGATAMDPNGYDANVQGNINAGVGVQYFFYKSIALRVEVRDFYTFVGGKNDVYLDGGLSFLF